MPTSSNRAEARRATGGPPAPASRFQDDPALPIRVKDLRVVLGGAPVVDGVSCTVQSGELLGIIGPNGSGKTTLLRTMAGLLSPVSGDVYLNGAPVRSTPLTARARAIAYLPQRGEHGHWFTALEAVLMGRYPHLGRFQVEGRRDREIALDAMARTETQRFAARKLGEISGGEFQRVLLARTLAQTPRILLLDEPTASLDLKHQLTMMAVVQAEVTNGVAAVAVMHDLSLAARFCDRLLLLKSGRVVADGKPGDVLTAQHLRDAFEVDAVVVTDPLTGRPRVVLVGPAVDGRSGRTRDGFRVHLICGAGSGRFLMQTLASAGHTVSASVLGDGDIDREAADQLGLEYVPSPPFSPISAESHARHVGLVRRADCVLVCDMPVGVNNLANLEAAAEARRLYLLADHPFHERDHTAGAAAPVFARLEQRGTKVLAGEVAAAIERDLAAQST